MAETILLTADEVGRALRRVGHELVEAHPDTERLVLFGIRTRGVPLARRIARNVEANGHGAIPVHELDTRPYRDDLPASPLPPNGHAIASPDVVTGRDLVLVDDVLFTGRTVRAALDAVVDLGRPRSVKLVALIDRGHRELPISADFVGKNIPTSRAQTVKVRVEEMDGVDEVVLLGSPVAAGGVR